MTYFDIDLNIKEHTAPLHGKQCQRQSTQTMKACAAHMFCFHQSIPVDWKIFARILFSRIAFKDIRSFTLQICV